MADNLNISPDMIENLVNMLKSSSNTESTDNSNSTSNNSSSPDLDFETILKFKSVMDALNSKNDNNSNLLYSLKPYLRKSKQEKLDQYINILKLSQISKFLKNEKGDSK